MKRLLTILLTSVLLLLLPSCAPQPTEQMFWHMDTAITVRLYGDATTTRNVLDDCDKVLTEADQMLSATRENSPVAQFNASADGRDVIFTAEALALIKQAIAISDATNGAFDITTAPLTALWQQCERDNKLPPADALAAALALVGREHLSLTDGVLAKDVSGVRIDLGGIGKGYACDVLLAELSANEDVSAALISMGSNVAVLGQKPDGSPWKVALRDPNDASSAIGYLHLTEGQILSVSGDYERYFIVEGGHYSHILDPETGYPPENGLRSVAVLCESGAMADALSTAFMVMGEESARALLADGVLTFEAVFVYDGRVSMTDGITLH